MKLIIVVWAALMILLAITVSSSMVPLGPANAILNFVIAAAKTVLVGLFFMHLRHSIALLRLIVAIGLFTLCILFVLSGADFVSRHIERSAWQNIEGASAGAATPSVGTRALPAK